MSKRLFYRAGRLITASAFALGCSKTLASTGEHDVWSGSGALPQPANTVIKVASASEQDAALVPDVWTVSDAEGTEIVESIDVDGVLHAAVRVPGDSSWDALKDAVNLGSKTTRIVAFDTLPDGGDDVVVSVGATDYTVTRDSESTLDEMAQAVATAMAADPSYDVVFAGAGTGAVLLAAKTPNVAGPAVAVDFPTTGTGSVLALVTHGPPSAVMSAAEEGGDLVLTANVRGTAYVVTAESDEVTVAHTQTGSAGTGVRKVLVRYLDADGYEREEELTLLGTTAVPTSRAASALLEVQASAVGSGGGAAGTITVTDGAGSPTTLGTIAAGDAETHRVAWEAGTDRRLLLLRLQGTNASGTAATLRLRSSGPLGARLLASLYLAANGGQVVVDLSETPIPLEEGETVRATLEGNGATCYVELQGYTESN